MVVSVTSFTFIISIYDLAYELFSIVCLHTVYDSGITRLRFRSGIWWKKSQLHIFKIIPKTDLTEKAATCKYIYVRVSCHSATYMYLLIAFYCNLHQQKLINII